MTLNKKKQKVKVTLPMACDSTMLSNHLEGHIHLSNKKALFYNMKMYYESLGLDPFDYIPLTFHILDTADLSKMKSLIPEITNGKIDYLSTLKDRYLSIKCIKFIFIFFMNKLKINEKLFVKIILDRNSIKIIQMYFRKILITKLIEPSETPENKLFGVWIVKPGENTNRGSGITVCRDFEQIKSIVDNKILLKDGKYRSYIVQKYIEHPLLINKRKFDIR